MFTPFVWLIIVVLIPTVVLVFLRWFVLPIKIRHAHPVTIKPGFTETTVDAITAEVRDLIGDFVRQFSNEGFVATANLLKDQGPSHPRAMQVLFVNKSSGDLGTLIFASAKLYRNYVFLVRSRFADGREVLTGCNREIGFLPQDPKVDTAVFSWATRVADIAEAHRRRLKKLRLENVARIVPEEGKEVAYAEERYEHETARFVSCGYFYRDDAAGIFRKTWKGTFLGPWKLIQPVKGWRMRYRDSQALKLWVELGMNKWSPDSATSVSVASQSVSPCETLPPPMSPIVYQSMLAFDELRISHDNGEVVVRMGKPSIGKYLLLHLVACCAFWPQFS